MYTQQLYYHLVLLQGIYPAVDSLEYISTMLQKNIAGEAHYATAQAIQKT